jgi:hypothetical protein
MKKLNLILAALLLFSLSLSAQIKAVKSVGGSVITDLGMGVKVNKGSSLNREWVLIHDMDCPVQLNSVGVITTYENSRYSFRPTGGVAVKQPITAFEVRHMLYNVFGEYIKTLSNVEVTDITTGIFEFEKYSSWFATESQVTEYFTVVSYVAYARTEDGVVWRYNEISIKEELLKLKISYDESYLPDTESTK